MPAVEARVITRIRFADDFELDARSYQLRRSGRVLKLERIPMEVLLLLVERGSQIVTRREIAARVWGEEVFLDTDNSINGAIRKIRHVLRDKSTQPRYIQTVTGQGYRFIAPVSRVPDGSIDVSESPVIAPPDINVPQPLPANESDPAYATSNDSYEESPTSTVRSVSSSATGIGRMILIAAVAVLLGGVTTSLVRFHFNGQTKSSSSRAMIAVLPLENLTGDPTQEYFSDGMTEEIITELGNLDPHGLGVIARTSVMHYKASRVPLNQIGRELGVDYVIEGSVRRDVERVRVTAQLIQTRDQTRVWAKEYDRELKEALVLQGEVAREIADEVQITLGGNNPAAKAASTLSPSHFEAHDLYLKGQYLLNKRTARDLEQAILYFEQAVAKDQQYAPAYAAIASCYALKGGYTGQAQTEFMPKARWAALRALEIDDHLAEAHAALALIVQNYDWDWRTAESEFRRAIELNPNNATAHHWYAEHLMWRGRFDEAFRESELARQLDPLSLIIAADNGAISYFSRQYDRAIDKWQRVEQLEPGLPRAHLIVGAYVEKGMFSEAISDIDKYGEVPASVLSWSAYIYGRAGQTAKAHRALVDLIELNESHPTDPMLIAWAYLGLSNKQETLVWLDKALSAHSTELVTMKVNPGYDPLRSDPQFQRLLRRVGLAD